MAKDCNTGRGSADSQQFVPEILYEDNHLLIVNKPAGMLTQADASRQLSLLEHLKRYIKSRDQKPGNVYLGLVQRLDKPVSGVLVFAKTSKCAGRISQQVRERKMTKYYLATTAAGAHAQPAGDGGDGDWREFTQKLRRVRDITIIDDSGTTGQTATLQLKTLLDNGTFGVHAVQLITGRKHQIRAQLAGQNMPICGDKKYGSSVLIQNERILLHSYLVRLVHPTKRTRLELICPPPAELLSPFNSLEQKEIVTALQKLQG